MKKKIIAVMVMLLLGFNVGIIYAAEQPMAEKYRQMFQSGNFCLEFYVTRITTDNKEYIDTMSYLPTTLINKGNTRGNFVLSTLKSVSKFPLLPGVVGFKKVTLPRVLYQDKKYYQFLGQDDNAVQKYMKQKVKVEVLMLPEEKLNYENLDPAEHWDDVKAKLSIPEEFSVFYKKDKFAEQTFNKQIPVYKGSGKRTAKVAKLWKAVDREYDCDQYVTDIKAMDGKVIAQEIYNMLYENGNLVRIQKYFVKDGKEDWVSDVFINKITDEIPQDTFTFKKKIKVYGGAKGDMQDLLDQPVQVETLGGENNAK